MSDVPLMRNGRPNPGGTGRYCLPPPGTCYCGECPHWQPLRAYDATHPTGSKDGRSTRGRRPTR